VEYYNKSLKIRKIQKDYNNVGNLLNSLGIAHAQRRSYKKALRCFSDSLSVRKTILGENHSEVAETLHNMGNCAAKQSDFDNAAIYYEQSLIIKRLNYGDESLSTANTLHNIGTVNEELGLFDDALKYFEDAYKIRRDISGTKSLNVAFSLHSIGKIYLKIKKLDKAQDSLNEALQIKKQHYVINHLSIAESNHQLAEALSGNGNDKDSLAYYEAALSTYEKKLGAHKMTTEVLDALGKLHLSFGNLHVSHRYLERSLVLKRMLFGDENDTVVDTLHLIGKLQGKSGDIDDALGTLKEALRIRRSNQGMDSLPVAAIVNDVGVIHLRRDQHNIARTCFSEALRIWKDKLDKNHKYLGEVLLNLAEIDHYNGDLDDAIDKLTEALSVMKLNNGERHVSVALVYYKLGLSLTKKK